MPYQQAKARTKSKYFHSAIMVASEKDDGFYVYSMVAHMDMLLPSGRVWFANEAEAKLHCKETMKIRPTDWIAHEGQPDWSSTVRAAVEESIGKYKEMRSGQDEGK
jgi:hypothetical protein